jgi:hypothetical protein
MSTDPVSNQVALPSGQQPSQQRTPTRTAVVPGPSVGALVGATLTFLLGILLGISNQGAAGTSMNLRVPALLAALLMVGQGAVDFRRGLVAKPTVEQIPENTPPQLTRELPPSKTVRTPRQNVSVMPPVKPTLSTLAVPIIVLTLAAWLGWADLVTSAPDSLAVLSLVASFALFALGWSLLPTRH